MKLRFRHTFGKITTKNRMSRNCSPFRHNYFAACASGGTFAVLIIKTKAIS